MNDYTKSVDELAKRKSHPRAMRATGEQSWAQLRAQADEAERRKLHTAMVVCIVALVVIAFVAYHVFHGPVAL